jgi:hypothetical protein
VTTEKHKHFCAALEYVLLGQRGFKVVSKKLLFLQYVFTLTAGKMATSIAHQRNILEIQKPVEVFS